MEKTLHTMDVSGKKSLSRQTIEEGFSGMKIVAAYIMLVIGWGSLLFANIVPPPKDYALIGFSVPWFLMATYAFWVKLSEPRRKPEAKVVGWTKYDEKYPDWHHDGCHSEMESADAEQAIVDEIRKRRYKFGGNFHQYGESGCPIMSDGSIYMVSMRQWGEIMSRVWGGDYCDYAWTDKMGKVPKQSGIKPRILTEDEKEARRMRLKAIYIGLKTTKELDNGQEKE